MSETKENKSRSDTFPVYMMMIWLPIFVMLIINTSHDPNSLLTDEQKIEKQKQIELRNEIQEKKWKEDISWWENGIKYFIKEKPMPFSILIGFGILFMLLKGISKRDYHELGFTNPRILFPLVGMIYFILWISDYSIYGIFGD